MNTRAWMILFMAGQRTTLVGQLPPLRERLKWGLATPQKCKRTSSSFLDLGLHQGQVDDYPTTQV
ncbi:hypothetical protein P4532_00045, partial [Geobacillus stearothermophilus]|uniref:hypothetical protein n=1 Tax=Geobacillus stearothermophilus TaxID=1422 RepID=UPI002E244BA1|nr:hypothetical protein [Geobacillus stearothermophilus]